MKKYLVLLISCLLCLSLEVAAEENLKDNRLHIDSSRLEENQETEVNSPLELAEKLFSAKDRTLLEQNEENLLGDFKKKQEQLFTQKRTHKKESAQIDALFSSQETVAQYATKVNTSVDRTSQTDYASGLFAIFYGIASLLLICGASFATYLINKGEE